MGFNSAFKGLTPNGSEKFLDFEMENNIDTLK
jgi:hypothetical protein